ncbi:Peptidase family M23 [Mariniphaga anaerophila]|uniref:Peptidase family M23 n=1 Tax=Mariniphaga anaerophila TaxID=1484053 RepID=A0A1M5AQS7_9BACT|nr:M23 family metallopeptidase [Mariniphaga anaerophila]SHF32516.1 Peptidase family M23 [Mariniphaga anaerophila]
MNRLFFFIAFFFLFFETYAQLVEVQANYNGVGDVDFVAYNNTPAPLFLNIDFADLENTTFNEPLPYIKLLEPGFNSLFTLQRYPDAEAPRFNYQIKTFKSNPMSLADLDFPYLIPFARGSEVAIFDVKNLTGFWGSGLPESWNATGFYAKPGDPVFASRTGTVVEVVGAKRSGDPQTWYHTWKNAVTLLQPDGTLICYHNVVDNDKKLKVGEKVFAGQQLGAVAAGSTELVVLIFQHSLNSADIRFIIPQFLTGEKDAGLLLASQKYKVFHPDEVRGLEMSNREKRRYLK